MSVWRKRSAIEMISHLIITFYKSKFGPTDFLVDHFLKEIIYFYKGRKGMAHVQGVH